MARFLRSYLAPCMQSHGPESHCITRLVESTDYRRELPPPPIRDGLVSPSSLLGASGHLPPRRPRPGRSAGQMVAAGDPARQTQGWPDRDAAMRGQGRTSHGTHRGTTAALGAAGLGAGLRLVAPFALIPRLKLVLGV